MGPTDIYGATERWGTLQPERNVTLRYGTWTLPEGRSVGAVMLLPGRSEFIEKHRETVRELLSRGLDVYALDHRGQGGSSRLLDLPHKGHIDTFETYVRDVHLFVDEVFDAEAHERRVLFAHSLGGHIGLRYLHDHPDMFERAVFTAPMVAINLPVPPLMKALAWLGPRIGMGEAYVPSTGPYGPRARRFAGNQLTSDIDRFEGFHAQIEADPQLALGGPTLHWMDQALRSCRLLQDPAYAAAIRTPVLIACAAADQVVDNEAQLALLEHLPNGRCARIPGARHEVLHERDSQRRLFWLAFDDFVKRAESAPETPEEAPATS